jgi:poly-gamma-glutamate synthesis protein (capsule biosynthesis protein)
MSVKIKLLGDFAPTWDIKSVNFDINFKKYDLILTNLETPLVKNLVPNPKAGPNLSGNPDLLHIFDSNNVVINLANNHIMDYGKVGLIQTIEECQNMDFSTIGAGQSLNDSIKPIIHEFENTRIGIISFAETQFGCADFNKAGYNPIINGFTEKLIQNLSNEVDICIVSVHGASEMCVWPSPKWQYLLRGYIDAGADIIYGHHSHVPQGYEEYNGGLIFYGLGNFVVNPENWKKKENTLWSLIPEVAVSKRGIEDYQINTAIIENIGTIIIRESDDNELQIHKNYLKHANQPLNHQELLSALWQEASIRMFNQFYAEWLGFNRKRPKIIINLKNLKSIFQTHKKNENNINFDYLLKFVCITCESHRFAIETALGVMSGEIDDLRTEETRDLVNRMMPWSKEFAD